MTPETRADVAAAAQREIEERIAAWENDPERLRANAAMARLLKPPKRPLLGQWWLAALFAVCAIGSALFGTGWQALVGTGFNALIVGVELGAIWQRYNERNWPQERAYLKEKTDVGI